MGNYFHANVTQLVRTRLRRDVKDRAANIAAEFSTAPNIEIVLIEIERRLSDALSCSSKRSGANS
jgi:hypothetical protein